MKRILLCSLALCFAIITFAQSKTHKIVLDFTSNDTASFSMIVRHARNIMNLAPGSRLEFVCHGPGLDLLVKDKSTVVLDIAELSEKLNVVFAACEATMKRRGVEKSQLVAQAITVPSAILEISARQLEGWSYVKEGH